MIDLIMPQTEISSDSKPAGRVFLIDSMSHIFRAFYAPMANRAAPLMTSQGQVTQAGRLGAGWTIIVRGEQATVREHGKEDWTTPLDGLVETTAG